MAVGDKINEYVDTAVTIHDNTVFDIDQFRTVLWGNGTNYQTHQVTWATIKSFAGVGHLGNLDLTQTDLARTYTFGTSTISDRLTFRNSDLKASLTLNGLGDVYNFGLQGAPTNTVFGLNSGRSATGARNAIYGMTALEGLVVGADNVAAGFEAGRYECGTTNPLTDVKESVFIGSKAYAEKFDDENSIVIGFGACGIGSDTTVIGNSNTTKTLLFGVIQSSNYSGTGERNIVADANGNLVVGAANDSLIVHVATFASLPGTGVVDSIYITDDTDDLYIWDTDSSSFVQPNNTNIYNSDSSFTNDIRIAQLKLDTVGSYLDFRNASNRSILKIDGARNLYLANIAAPAGESYFLKIGDDGKVVSSPFSVVNYYTSDGALLENRTVSCSGFTSTWDGGSIITKSDGITDNGIFVFDDLGGLRGGVGYDVALDSGTLGARNSAGAFFTAVDGVVGIGTSVVLSDLFNLRGAGSDDTTTSIRVADSNNRELLILKDDGSMTLGVFDAVPDDQTTFMINGSSTGTTTDLINLYVKSSVNNSPTSIIALFEHTASGSGGTGSILKLKGGETVTGQYDVLNVSGLGIVSVGPSSGVAMLDVRHLNDLTTDAYISGSIGARFENLGARLFSSASDTTKHGVVITSTGAFVNTGAGDVINTALDVTVSGSDFNYAAVFNGGEVGIGTSIPTGLLHVDQSSLTGAAPVLKLDQADLSEEFIDFIGVEGVGNSIEDVGAKTLTTTKFFTISINGVKLKVAAGTIA